MDRESHLNEQRVKTSPLHEKRPFNWKIFLILTLGPAFVSLLSLPLGAAQLHITITWTLLLEQFFTSLVISAILAFLGLSLGRSIGLGAPMMDAWFAGNPDMPRQFRRTLPLAIGLGIVAGVIIVVLALLMGAFFGYDVFVLHTKTSLSPVLGLLASFDAPLREEVWFRLGIMTLLIWLGCKLLRREKPSLPILWGGLVVSALIFAASHWQNFPSPTLALVMLAVLTNFVPGLILGWLYWRKGLLVAIVAHFCGDIIVHVIAPTLLLFLK